MRPVSSALSLQEREERQSQTRHLKMAGCSAAAAFVLRGRVGTEKTVLEVCGGNLDVMSIDLS